MAGEALALCRVVTILMVSDAANAANPLRSGNEASRLYFVRRVIRAPGGASANRVDIAGAPTLKAPAHISPERRP
jgi:hypothetical protein